VLLVYATENFSNVFFQILEIIRVILKLYEQWKNFDERKEMATILSKMPKPKPPTNRNSLIDSPLVAGPEATR
jgi:hypothetical protein